MSDPKQHHDEPDELDLDAETVRDLDVSDGDADAARGGAMARRSDECGATDTCFSCFLCVTVVYCVAKP